MGAVSKGFFFVESLWKLCGKFAEMWPKNTFSLHQERARKFCGKLPKFRGNFAEMFLQWTLPDNPISELLTNAPLVTPNTLAIWIAIGNAPLATRSSTVRYVKFQTRAAIWACDPKSLAIDDWRSCPSKDQNQYEPMVQKWRTEKSWSPHSFGVHVSLPYTTGDKKITYLIFIPDEVL